MSRSATVLTEMADTAEFRFDLSESRLRPPPIRPGTVRRETLLERLDAASAPVIAVVAPAGFGKSALLQQWAAAQRDQVAWLSVDQTDNEPEVFAAHLVGALATVAEFDARVRDAITARRPPTVLIDRTVSWLADIDAPVGIVLDSADALRNPESTSMLTQIALHMPFRHRLLVATREALPWPAARMRAEGRLTEIGVRNLSLDNDEAVALLEAAGVTLSEADADELIARTEGWAAGLYLSALAIQAGSPADRAGSIPHGDHPYLAEYLRSELLDRLPVDEMTFLTRTSVLDWFNGALCDAVVGAEDSSARLEEIAKRNLMLHSVDAGGQWYRYHPSFRELLLAELERREHNLVLTLHERAAVWCETNGFAEFALTHAQSARDSERSVRLLLELVAPVFHSGRAKTALTWLQWLADEQLIETNAALAAHGAMLYTLWGRPAEAERWADAAERAPLPDVLPDGSAGMSMLRVIRAQLVRSGPEAVCIEAALAYEGFAPRNAYRTGMLFAQGAALWAQSEDDAADIFLMRAYDAAVASEQHPIAAMALAERAAITASAGEWDEAIRLVEDALVLIDDGSYDEYWTSAIVFAWAARVAQHQNDHARAREFLARASRLRPLLTYVVPIVSVQTLLEMGRTCLALADPAGARAVLRQANDILAQRPLLGRLGPELDALREELDSSAIATVGASSLTAAELRLVPLLATHLTLREIGNQLYVSRNTVSTQTSSIYRKLGVSSRSDAVASLRELGLLVQ
jgi:LuxR family maltose regulon positive regulatory protein